MISLSFLALHKRILTADQVIFKVGKAEIQPNSETRWGSAIPNKEFKLHIGKREKERFSQRKVK